MEEPGDADVPLSKAPDPDDDLVTCLRGVSCLRKTTVNERFRHHFPFSRVFLEEYEEPLP